MTKPPKTPAVGPLGEEEARLWCLYLNAKNPDPEDCPFDENHFERAMATLALCFIDKGILRSQLEAKEIRAKALQAALEFAGQFGEFVPCADRDNCDHESHVRAGGTWRMIQDPPPPGTKGILMGATGKKDAKDAEIAMLREALDGAREAIEDIQMWCRSRQGRELKLPDGRFISVDRLLLQLQAALSSTAGAKYAKRVKGMEELILELVAPPLTIGEDRARTNAAECGWPSEVWYHRARALIEGGKS